MEAYLFLKTGKSIIDDQTVQDIAFIETIEPDMIVINYGVDPMDYGNHDYYAHDIVIDPMRIIPKM